MRQLQRAGIDGRPAGIGVGLVQGERVGADLGQPQRAEVPCGGLGLATVGGVERQRSAVLGGVGHERVDVGHGPGARQLQRAAVEDDLASGVVARQRGRGIGRQRAGIEDRAAGVAVAAGKGERTAGAGFDHGDVPAVILDGRGHGDAVVAGGEVEVAAAAGRGQTAGPGRAHGEQAGTAIEQAVGFEIIGGRAKAQRARGTRIAQSGDRAGAGQRRRAAQVVGIGRSRPGGFGRGGDVGGKDVAGGVINGIVRLGRSGCAGRGPRTDDKAAGQILAGAGPTGTGHLDHVYRGVQCRGGKGYG